jgi:hypothetical protein
VDLMFNSALFTEESQAPPPFFYGLQPSWRGRSMPKFPPTAEVGTQHTPDGFKPRKVIVIQVAVMT